MTRDKFAKFVKMNQSRAIDLVIGRGGNREDGEDATQEAAVYFLKRLGSYTQITPSLFFQYVTRRFENARHKGRGHRGQQDARPRVVSVGLSDELAEVEEINERKRIGRTLPHRTKNAGLPD